MGKFSGCARGFLPRAVIAFGLFMAFSPNAGALVMGDLVTTSHLSEKYVGYVPIRLGKHDDPKDMDIHILPLGEPIADGAFGVNYADSLSAEYSSTPSPRIIITSTRIALARSIPFRLVIGNIFDQPTKDFTIALADAATNAISTADNASTLASADHPVDPAAATVPAAPLGAATITAPADLPAKPAQPPPSAANAALAIETQPIPEPVAATPETSVAVTGDSAPAMPAAPPSPAALLDAPLPGAASPTTPLPVTAPPSAPASPAPATPEEVNVAAVTSPTTAAAPTNVAPPGQIEAVQALPDIPAFTDIPPQAASGAYASRARKAEEALHLKTGTDGQLPPVKFVSSGTLDHLRAAEGWRVAGSLKRSIEQYDAAESALKSVETESMAASGGKLLASLLVNDNMLSYTPSPSEAVLMNFDKALSLWALGDQENARVELNRAEDRTRRAVERYESEIKKAQEADSKNSAVNGAASSTKVLDGVDAKIPEVAQWHTYSEFVNPAATYLHALFLARKGDSGDVSTAQNLMKRVSGIVGSNTFLEMDLAEINQGVRPCQKNNCSWILVEAGKGPILEERRIDIPFPSPGGAIYSVSVALPVLKSRKDPGSVRITTPEGMIAPPVLGDMDVVVQTEFKKRWPGIVARAVGSAAVKTIAQKEIADHTGPFGSLIGAIGSMLITHADVRMWDEMPGRWYLARIDGALDKDIALSGPGLTASVHLPKVPSLIYIKPTDDPGTPPLIHMLDLQTAGSSLNTAVTQR